MNTPAKNKLLSRKLFDALQILKQDYVDSEIIDFLKEKNSKFKLSKGYFSKLKLAFQNKKYANEVNDTIYLKIFSHLDPLIETEYGFSFNESSHKYDPIPGFIKPNFSPLPKDRLDSFIGVWRGYSWNAKETDNSKKLNSGRAINYYNVYRIQILESGEVICETKNGLFKKGKVEQITEDRVVIKLEMPKRRIYLAAKLGFTSHKHHDVLLLAYIDTGNDDVKCGLTVIRKVDTEFSTIEIGSQPRNYFTKHPDEKYIDFLTKTQSISTYLG